MAEIQNLDFKINVNVDGSPKAVGTLANNIKKLSKATKEFNPEDLTRVKNSIEALRGLSSIKISGSIANQISKITSSLKGFGRLETSKFGELAKSLEKLGTSKGLTISSTIGKQISEIANSLKQLDDGSVDKLSKFGEAAGNLNSVANLKISSTIGKQIGLIAEATNNITQEQIDKIRELGDALKGFKGLGNITLSGLKAASDMAQVDMSNIEPEIFGEGLEDSFQDVDLSFWERAGNAISNFKEKVSGLMDGPFGKVISTLKTAGKAALSFGADLAKSVGNGIKEKVLGIASSFGKLASSLKRIMFYRAIRGLISGITKALKDGVNNIYEYSKAAGTSFAGAMNDIATNANYVKNSLGAMAAPLLQAVAPAIDFLVNKFVTLLNVINQVFAALMGKTVTTVAKKIETSYEGASKSASKTAKSAKEAVKTILGFDEINKLNKDHSSGSGSGSGAGDLDFANMFEEKSIDGWIKKLTDKIKQHIEKGDWNGLGRLLADKFNTLFSDDKLDAFKNFGDKIGDFGTAVFETLDAFVSNSKWQNIGKRLGDIINGFMEHFDFYALAHSIVTGITILPEIIIGFVNELDWGEVGESLSELLKGAFDGASDFVARVDWGKFGANAYNGIIDFIQNIDWGGVTSSIIRFIGEVIGGIITFVMGVFSQFGQDIDKFLTDVGSMSFKDFLDAAWEVVKNIGQWLYENVISPFIEGFKDGFGISGNHSDETQKFGEAVIESFKEGMENKFNSAFRSIKGFCDDVLWWVRDLYDDVSSYCQGIINWVSSALSSKSKVSGGSGSKGKFASGGIIYDGGISVKYFADGGIIPDSVYKKVRKYASGGSVHGSMFVAGESGPELIGHVNGRSEVLNQSQIAGAIYSAVYSAERNSSSNEYNLMLYEQMLEQNNILREEVELLRSIDSKEFGNEITANSIEKAFDRQNRRNGRNIITIG